MFVNIAFVTPQPENEKELAERMHAFAEALRTQPGLQRIHVLKEKEGNTLLGISMWDNEELFDQAMKNVATRPANSAKNGSLRPNPPVVRQFYEV